MLIIRIESCQLQSCYYLAGITAKTFKNFEFNLKNFKVISTCTDFESIKTTVDI